MEGMKRLIPGLCAALLIVATAGCSSRVTNLTPSGLPREEGGLYHFETEWETTQRSVELRASDIRAWVVVDQKAYPMQRVPKMTNRWEADLVLPKDKAVLYYFYKWDYLTAGWGHNNVNSRRSQQYRLEVLGAGQ